jgi:hypothetical protein
MQQPHPGPIKRAVYRALVPVCYSEYRRLEARRLILSARLEVLSAVVTLVLPFATPGVVRVLRRRSDRLRADVKEFGHMVRSRRPRTEAALRPASPFQNPWV